MDKYAKNEQRRLLWWKKWGAENFSVIEIAPKISQILVLHCSKIRTFTQGPGVRWPPFPQCQPINHTMTIIWRLPKGHGFIHITNKAIEQKIPTGTYFSAWTTFLHQVINQQIGPFDIMKNSYSLLISFKHHTLSSPCAKTRFILTNKTYIADWGKLNWNDHKGLE